MLTSAENLSKVFSSEVPRARQFH